MKQYTDQNVWDALQDRLAYIFGEFDSVYVAFSGGKDSGVLLNAIVRYMREHNIDRPVGVYHLDMEATYRKTAEYVERTFASLPPNMEPFWLCLPVAARSAVNNTDMYWYPWDDQKESLWVRPMPERAYNLSNNPVTRYKHKMLYSSFDDQFGKWYRDTHGGKTIVLLGVRADESLHRYSAIANKRFPYKGKPWITTNAKNLYSASPLYDWRVEDIWTANARFDFDYNRLYDLFYMAGLPLDDMRVASPFHDDARNSLNLFRVLEPETWTKIVGRVSGANFAAIYGGTKAMGFREISLPEGHTWKSYTKFLLSTLPDNIRNNYIRRFATSIRFWYKTGGGFSEDIIAEIESCGYEIKRNGVSNFTKDKKERIVFGGIPDATDDVRGTLDIPSWKRMAFCILKNDHMCKYMGFGLTREQMEVKKKIKEYYMEAL